MRATCFAHLVILLDLITLVILFGAHCAVPLLCLTYVQTLPSPLCSHICSFHVLPLWRETNPHKTAGNITLLYISICKFLKKRTVASSLCI
jgi:hypothetical protein